MLNKQLAQLRNLPDGSLTRDEVNELLDKYETLRQASKVVILQLETRYDDQWATGSVNLADLDALRDAVG